MSHLEDELRSALRREAPSAHFARRVAARAFLPVPPAWWRQVLALFQPPKVQWVALSLIASLVIPLAGLQYRVERQRRNAGEMAKERLVLALRIASSKLHKAQTKIHQIYQTESEI